MQRHTTVSAPGLRTACLCPSVHRLRRPASLWAEQPKGSSTQLGRLSFAALVRAGLGRIFLSQTLTTLSELPYPLANGFAYLGKLPHPKDQHEHDQEDEQL